ncbi:hypothetical protein ACFRDV_23770 [Streptomyces fagopyri]
MLQGEVHINGEPVHYQWWNRLCTGIEIDLTRGESTTDELPGAS